MIVLNDMLQHIINGKVKTSNISPYIRTKLIGAIVCVSAGSEHFFSAKRECNQGALIENNFDKIKKLNLCGILSLIF